MIAIESLMPGVFFGTWASAARLAMRVALASKVVLIV
jgi:hypothetical protein